jgi:Flp pilus assembly protein CpaB
VKRSNRLVILVGVLLAVLAFVAVIILLNSRETPTPEEEEIRATVLIATRDIAVGDEVTPGDVEVAEIDPEAVSGTALVDPSQLANRVALIAVPEGAQVNEEVFGQLSGAINIAGQLEPGEKAIAIRVDQVTGMDFLLKPGDNVDIVISQEVTVLQPTADSLENPDQPPRFEPVEGLDSVRTVKTVLQNKRLLYVSNTNLESREPQLDPDTGEPIEGAAPATPILSAVLLFAGTDADAELVRFQQRDSSELSSERFEISGSISVVLRHPDDDAIEETEGLTIDGLIERYGVPIPGIVEQLNEEAGP